MYEWLGCLLSRRGSIWRQLSDGYLGLTFANVVHGTNTSGPLANQVDISPSFAGIMLGITASCSAMIG